MNNLLHDLRYAVRSLGKARGFAAVAILTLAFALGANTAIFSVVSAILLQPLPFEQPHELMLLSVQYPAFTANAYSWPNYRDIRRQAKTIDRAAAYSSSQSFLYASGIEPERFSGAMVTHDLWPMLGVKPLLGRGFSEQEDRFGQPPVAVISETMWRRRFNADPTIIGKQIRLGNTPKTVVGVMPPGFKFPLGSAQPTDFWTSLGQENENETDGRGAIWMGVLVRLKDNATRQQFQTELTTISKRIEQQFPEENTGVRFLAEPLHDMLVSDVRPALIVLMCAVGVVLLIGCANVANLLLARAAVRHKEISIRSAIGASRGRIVRQLLVESVLLSMLAGALGLLLATWGVDLLVALAPAEIPRREAIGIDRPVLLFTLALSVLTGIIFGLAPALSASKTNLVEALKEGSRGSTEGRRRNRVRSALVVAEIALSVFLLVGAGLLLRSFVRLSGVDPGYNYRNAIALDVSARTAVFPEDENLVQFQKRAREQLRAIPGVTSVGMANHLPLGNSENIFSFNIVGRPPFPDGQEPNAGFVAVSPGYFETMGIPILRGRPVTEQDVRGGQRVVVVSESFARQYLGKENPLGKQVEITDGDGVRTIVGVAGDIRFVSLTDPPKPFFYVAHSQSTTRRMQFVVRAPNAATLGPTLRTAIRKIDREQPILGIRTLEEIRSESLASRRFMLVLTAVLAALALVLAVVGIYSIMSYTVTQRTSEIGIRMSLGAEARDILRLIVGQALRLVGIGIAVGVLVALVATRVMTTLLYGITATDPATFVSICFIIGSIALIASYVPANRATKVDPLVAIRYD
ncbi:MAG TPA: ABC transporter permease [Thermoanaerobaculia bacterium]|jgi:putative ABC transport system permease protein